MTETQRAMLEAKIMQVSLKKKDLSLVARSEKKPPKCG